MEILWAEQERPEMGERYMVFEEMMQEEREEGIQEGMRKGTLIAKREAVLELLEELEPVPQSLQEKLQELDDVAALGILLKKAAKADSMESFLREFDAFVKVE